MYKLLLCWRYLRTRWIALASVISVTLGVATMIVVNAVMAGFSHEMQTRIHGILSDLVFESHSLSGFQDPQWHMEEIRRAAGDQIAGMTPTVAVPAMLNFQVRGQWITRQIMFIGIDEATHASVSDFGRYLQHPANRTQLSFDLRDGEGAPDEASTGFAVPVAEHRSRDVDPPGLREGHSHVHEVRTHRGREKSIWPPHRSIAVTPPPSRPVPPSRRQAAPGRCPRRRARRPAASR